MWEQCCREWKSLQSGKGGAPEWDRVDNCSKNKLKRSHPSLKRDTEGNCGLSERLPWTLVSKVKLNIRFQRIWLQWVRARGPKHWNFIPLYSSLWWLRCDDSRGAIVSPKPSPWELPAVHESLCMAGNTRGFRGRSHPESLPWHS